MAGRKSLNCGCACGRMHRRWLYASEKMRLPTIKKSGILSVNGTDYPIGCDVRDFSFLLDDVILEVTAKYDTIIGVFELQERECIIEIERDAFEKMQMNRM